MHEFFSLAMLNHLRLYTSLATIFYTAMFADELQTNLNKTRGLWHSHGWVPLTSIQLRRGQFFRSGVDIFSFKRVSRNLETSYFEAVH